MSRSRKKRPFTTYVVCHSQKEDKQLGNRRLRRISKQLTDTWAEQDLDLIYPVMDEIMDVWSMAKDGPSHYSPFSMWHCNSWFEYYKCILMK